MPKYEWPHYTHFYWMTPASLESVLIILPVMPADWVSARLENTAWRSAHYFLKRHVGNDSQKSIQSSHMVRNPCYVTNLDVSRKHTKLYCFSGWKRVVTWKWLSKKWIIITSNSVSKQRPKVTLRKSETDVGELRRKEGNEDITYLCNLLKIEVV
jgi:hypothetical protein